LRGESVNKGWKWFQTLSAASSSDSYYFAVIPGCLTGNLVSSIAGLRVIANPSNVFQATVVLSRLAKSVGIFVWLKERAGKGGQKLTSSRMMISF
jgi:hypothetical protein